jgi:hypothetical protein
MFLQKENQKRDFCPQCSQEPCSGSPGKISRRNFVAMGGVLLGGGFTLAGLQSNVIAAVTYHDGDINTQKNSDSPPLRNRRHPVQYFPIVRVSASNGEHGNAEKLYSLLEKYPNAFKAVVFFDANSHDLLSVSEMREFARKIQPVLHDLKKSGYQVGVNHLSTVGHHAESPNPELKDMDFLVTSSGHVKPGTLCPSSPKTLAYIASTYTEIAQLDVDIIYSDDDLHYNMDCHCDHCRSKFDGGNWLRFKSERANRIYREIENAVHNVHKRSTIGFMLCDIGYDGGGYEDWSESLCGENKRVLCRPGGGVWTDIIPGRILEKAHKIGRQICSLPEFVETQSEIENFPQQTLNKSARFVSLEVLSYIAVGCTGTAYSMPAFYQNTESEIARHFEALDKLAPFAAQMTKTFGTNPPCGVGYWWDGGREGRVGFDDHLYDIGIPACYHTDGISVFLLTGTLAENMTDNQIMQHLKTGVMMDAEALTILNRRGFGHYTGFIVKDKFTGNIQEKTLPHALNGDYVGFRRWVPFEFAGHPDLGRNRSELSQAYTIEKSASAAEYLTECVDFRGTKLGDGSGLFENELGGRVCVGGFMPFDFCYIEWRAAQVKTVLKWLSKDTLPAYTVSLGKTALWFRQTTEGHPGVILSNISLDDMREFDVAVLTNSQNATFTYFDGEQIRKQQLSCATLGQGYKTVCIPFLPSLTVGYLVLPGDERTITPNF